MTEVNEEQIEQQAKAMGWVPEEDFKGDPEKWKSAKDFVEFAQTKFGPLRENLDRMTEKFNEATNKISELQSTIQQDRKTFEEFREFTTKAQEKEQKRIEADYNRKLKDLRGELKRAAKEGDEWLVDRILGDIDSLESNRPEPVAMPSKSNDGQQQNQVSPEFEAWKAQNPWYGKDPNMTMDADLIGRTITAHNPNVTPQEHLRQVTEAIKERYPARFKADEPPPPGPDSPSDTPPVEPPKGKITWGKLPDNEKAAFERMNRLMPNYTREQFLKDYNAQYGA